MKATKEMATEYTDHTDLPFGVRWVAGVLPRGDRESIVGDLIEDADYRGLRGARRRWWIAAECAAIAAGLSVQRVRGWFVLPPVREVAAGLAVDGRGVRRGGGSGTLIRAIVFVTSVATLAFAAEVLVRTLMTAAGL